MWILLAFNKNYNKTVICNITLLKNENFETFDILLKYRKSKYNFHPQIMIVDFKKASYETFKLNFENIKMVLAFFIFFKECI